MLKTSDILPNFVKGLLDKYKTDKLNIPHMFQGTIQVYYLNVITILSLILNLLLIFLSNPFSMVIKPP